MRLGKTKPIEEGSNIVVELNEQGQWSISGRRNN